jgi:hypothetical protein
MISSGGGSFRKQPDCPSAKTLLDYRRDRLAAEAANSIKGHLHECDFCWAEFQILEHHGSNPKGEAKPPAIPVNLRVLAEALMRNKSFRTLKKKLATF